MCGCESSTSAGLSFRCGVKRRLLVVKSVQILRDIFDMRRWIPIDTMQAFNTRSPRYRRHAEVMPMDFSLAASLLARSSFQISPSIARVKQRRGSLKTEGPGVVFDMKYRTVSYFVATERVDESRPKIQREVGDTSTH